MKKIKYLKYSILCISMTLVIIMGFKIKQRIDKNRQMAIVQEKLPDFRFYTMNGALFLKSDLISTRPTMIVYFHPECEHCHYQTADMIAHIDSLSTINLLMVSYEEEGKVKEFMSEFDLQDYPFINVLLDKNHSFYDYFGINSVPSSIIFDKHQKLVRLFKGETKMETLLKNI